MSQNSADAVFKQAVDSFENKNYSRAAELFDKLLTDYPMETRFSIFWFMKARSHHKLGDLELAEKEFEDFISEFPYSRYIGEALLLLGDIRFQQNDPFGAAYYYIQAYDRLDDSALQEKARISLSNVIEVHISLARLNDLATRADNYQLSAEMHYLKAKREIREKRFEKAAETISRLREKYSNSEYALRAQELELGKSREDPDLLRIGLLIPLSGRYSEYGIDMLRGIKLALEDFNTADTSTEVELEVYDNLGTSINTVEGTKELIESGVDVIIGPLQSENAFAAAVICQYENVPLVVPAASGKGIAAVGRSIFQLSPDSEYIGKRIANYAIIKLGLEQFGIITPNDAYGEDVSATFVQEVKRLNGEVIKIAFYQRGMTDFRRPLTEIKEVLTKDIEQLLEEGLADSSLYANPKRPEELLPKYEWPVRLDGLFIPGFADEVAMIAPQVVFGQMETTLLGAEGWSDPDVLKSAKGYLDGAVFATDFYPFPKAPRWSRFSARFQNQYGISPGRVAGLSYDAAMILLTTVGEIGNHNVTHGLNKIEDYKGVSGDVTFKSMGGLNSEVMYCKIVGDEVVRLNE
ncbi:MAG: ABC transporter substrate-binding protein [candidate division Zixibacteria bacterium]|nr:ABC transporter substrate-binding protein [candidate division Zixibacteria bacterium]